MSGCANCVWIDYANETVDYFKARGETLPLAKVLDEVSRHVDDPMVKAFIDMEIKFAFKKKGQ